MKRICYVVTIDFADETEGAEAECDLLNAVADIGDRYAVKAEANYDRTIEISDLRAPCSNCERGQL